MEWLQLIEKAIWFGFAGLGFAILFNVPKRVLFTIWLFSAIGGLTKLMLMKVGASIILSSFGGSILIGVLTIQAAHNNHAPPLVFSIPAVIPMVLGVFAYRMMLGVIKLAGSPAHFDYQKILFETVNNGLNMFFILLALAVGGSLPLLVTRKESVKKLKIVKKH